MPARRPRSSGSPGSTDDAFDDLQRQLVAPERRHDIGAGYAILHIRQHLARNGDALAAPRRARAGPAHALANVRGNVHSWYLVVKELGVAVARQRQEAHEHRNPEVFNVFEHAIKDPWIVDRLRHHELSARIALLPEPLHLAVIVVGAWLRARRAEEPG